MLAVGEDRIQIVNVIDGAGDMSTGRNVTDGKTIDIAVVLKPAAVVTRKLP